MSAFETILACFLIPVVYVLTYIAGKYDIISTICNILKEKEGEYATVKDLEEEKWNDAGDPLEDFEKLIKEGNERLRNPPPCNGCIEWYPHCMDNCLEYRYWEKKRKENKNEA